MVVQRPPVSKAIAAASMRPPNDGPLLDPGVSSPAYIPQRLSLLWRACLSPGDDHRTRRRAGLPQRLDLASLRLAGGQRPGQLCPQLRVYCCVAACEVMGQLRPNAPQQTTYSVTPERLVAARIARRLYAVGEGAGSPPRVRVCPSL